MAFCFGAWVFGGSWALCRPSGTRVISLSLPGTNVPGYRLCRPSGTCGAALPALSYVRVSLRFNNGSQNEWVAQVSILKPGCSPADCS